MVLCACGGISETKQIGEGLSVLLVGGVFPVQMCLCSGFDGLFCCYGMLLGVWGNTVVVLKNHPFDVGKILLVAA